MSEAQINPRAGQVGLSDRSREGWLNAETGELVEGVKIRPFHTVVDVGCGDGGFISFCARQGAEVIFIDRDEQRLAGAERAVKPTGARAYRAIVSDCEPIPLEDATADYLICTEVLEHVADPAAFLVEMMRVVKPGGKLVLTVPDARSEQLVGATAPLSYFQEPNHIRVFSAESFRELVSAAGLTIERHKFMGCFWSIYWPLAWLTAEPGKLGLPIDNGHPITDAWVAVWKGVQDHPNGGRIRDALNELLPKSQCIVAQKAEP